jgi:DNA-binding MarR family transcriptional regulator
MSAFPPGGPLPVSPVYAALMERLVLPTAVESIHRTLTVAFDLDARQQSDHDEAVLRVLLCIRLAPDRAMRAKDIATQVLKSTSHMSRLIDRAEAGGLVERLADPTDRRAYRVALTPQGESEIDAYVPHALRLLDEAFATVLSADELHTLLALVGRVETAAKALVAKQEAALRS